MFCWGAASRFSIRDGERTSDETWTGPERVYARPRRVARAQSGDDGYAGESTDADGWPQSERSPQSASRQRQRRIAATENMRARGSDAGEEPDVLSRAWRGGRETSPRKRQPVGALPGKGLDAADSAASSEALTEAGGKTVAAGPDPLALAQLPRSVGTVLNRAMSNTGIFTGGAILGAILAHEQGASSLLSVQTAGFAPLARGLGGSTGGYTPPGFDYALSRPPIPVVSYLGTAVAPPELPATQGTGFMRPPFDSPVAGGAQNAAAASPPQQDTSRDLNIRSPRDADGASSQSGAGNAPDAQRQSASHTAQSEETAQSSGEANSKPKSDAPPRARRFDPAGLWGLAAGSAAIALLLSLSGRAHANPAARAILSQVGQAGNGSVSRVAALLLANPNAMQSGAGMEPAMFSPNAGGFAAGAGFPTSPSSFGQVLSAGAQTTFGRGRPGATGILSPLHPANIGVGRTNLLTGRPFTSVDVMGMRGGTLPGQAATGAKNTLLQQGGAAGLPGQGAPRSASLRPEMGQITLIAPPMNVASSQAERGGVATAFDWNTLAMGAGPLDEAGWTRLKSTLPPDAQLIYPALPPGSAGVNLPLAPGLLQSLLAQGYAPGTADMAAEASRKGAQGGAARSSSPALPGRIVPVGTPPGAQAGLLETPGSNSAAGSLAEAGHGQAKRGGALDFLGMPVRLAPSLGGKPELAAEVAARHGGAESGSPVVVRPELFAPLRDRLFPQYQSVAAEMDRGAWNKAAPAYGLRDSDPATLLSPDARVARPTATSSLPQMSGGAGAARLAPMLAQAFNTGAGHGNGGAMSMSRFLSGDGPFGAGIASPHLPPAAGNSLTGLPGRSTSGHASSIGASVPSLPMSGPSSSLSPGAPHTSSGMPFPGGTASPSALLSPGAMSFSPPAMGPIPASSGSPARSSSGSGGAGGGSVSRGSSLPIMPAAPFVPAASAGAALLPITGRQSPSVGRSSGASLLPSNRFAGSGASSQPYGSADTGGMSVLSPLLSHGSHAGSLPSTGTTSRPIGSRGMPILPSLPAEQGHGSPSVPSSGGFAPMSLPVMSSGASPSGLSSMRAMPGHSAPSLTNHFNLPQLPTHGAEAGTHPLLSMPLPMSASAPPMPTHSASSVSSRLPDRLADRAPTLTLPPVHAGRGSARRPASGDGLVIQRSETGSAPQSRTAEKSAQPPRASALASGENSGKASEVQLLASEVWSLLKRRMAVEAERRGRW